MEFDYMDDVYEDDDLEFEETEAQDTTDVEVEGLDVEELDWKVHYKENLGMSDEMIEALDTKPGLRDYMQTELVDLARHPYMEGQRSILTDLETGLVVKDENGDFVECPRNTKGAQRPDAMFVDEAGNVEILESKCYHDVNALKNNIREQTASRYGAWGDDIDLTYSIAANEFTIEDADKLHALEDELDINIEFQYK